MTNNYNYPLSVGVRYGEKHATFLVNNETEFKRAIATAHGWKRELGCEIKITATESTKKQTNTKTKKTKKETE